MFHSFNPSYLEAKIRRTVLRPEWANSSQDPQNKTRAKWTGGVAKVVEHLLCKCEALSSNPSPTEVKKINK
jgi:hypothetical protein